MSYISRAKFLTLSCATAAVFKKRFLFNHYSEIKNLKKNNNMYGLIGNITVHTGRRDDLITILLNGTVDMPGCLMVP